MNLRLLLLLALTVAMVIPASAAHASTVPASKYRRIEVLPPGAGGAFSAGAGLAEVGNAMNSDGNVAANAAFGSLDCGSIHAFAYTPKTHQYVVFGNPPGVVNATTETIGIADDNTAAVQAEACSGGQTLIYQVSTVGTTPQWSQPCACSGYLDGFSEPPSPLGYNSDGVALNSPKLGPAALTFPDGTPRISPLQISVGIRAKARITGVGTPSGFVGDQFTRKHHHVPTVWLDGQPYRLPMAGHPGTYGIPYGMDERQTAYGFRVDVVGDGAGGAAYGADYWLGKPTAKGFRFVEKTRFIRNSDMSKAYGISTDGSTIFGLNGYAEGLVIYLTASHKEVHNNADGCGAGARMGRQPWRRTHRQRQPRIVSCPAEALTGAALFSTGSRTLIGVSAGFENVGDSGAVGFVGFAWRGAGPPWGWRGLEVAFLQELAAEHHELTAEHVLAGAVVDAPERVAPVVGLDEVREAGVHEHGPERVELELFGEDVEHDGGFHQVPVGAELDGSAEAFGADRSVGAGEDEQLSAGLAALRAW